jgi:hypothetical protein
MVMMVTALILDTLAYMTGTVVLGPNEVPTSMARPRETTVVFK